MGSGSWTTQSFQASMSTRGFDTSTTSALVDSVMSLDTAQVYTARHLHPTLNPKNVVRECCDTEEHPETIPVILALDVTGSMGAAAKACAAKLNEIMTSLYEKVNDIQFMTMAIGDFAYDRAPLQVSQYESDIRILEQMDQIYFEGGGGGNSFESYTAAWYFALKHTKLDCHNRGKKGIIITLGDEPLNPYLPRGAVENVIGDKLQGDVDTQDLYREVTEKFDVYHISVDDNDSSYHYHRIDADATWKRVIGENYKVSTLQNLAKTISDIIVNSAAEYEFVEVGSAHIDSDGNISW
jgi:hypothetical protein